MSLCRALAIAAGKTFLGTESVGLWGGGDAPMAGSYTLIVGFLVWSYGQSSAFLLHDVGSWASQ